MSSSTSRPPRVLQILPRLGTGGVERTAVDVAAALMAAGWDATVVSEGGPLEHQITRTGAQHITLPVASKSPYRIWRNIAALADVIRDQQVDLIHARSRAPAWSALYAAKRTHIPFVTTFHGTYAASTPWKKAYNSVMVRGQRVIANSQFIGTHITKTYPSFQDRVTVIPRGIDMRIFDPNAIPASRIIALSEAWRLRDGEPVILLPGRLTRWKGHKLLIDSLIELGRKDIRCIMAGPSQSNPSYKFEMEAYATKCGLASVVQFVENCNDMPAAYMLADVVVSASTDPEAFGRVAVEAQAMGRPVVATNHGGSSETIIENTTGWLVDPQEPRSMARALERALGLHPTERLEMAEVARKHVYNTYTTERMTGQTIAVYTDILKGRV